MRSCEHADVSVELTCSWMAAAWHLAEMAPHMSIRMGSCRSAARASMQRACCTQVEGAEGGAGGAGGLAGEPESLPGDVG